MTTRSRDNKPRRHVPSAKAALALILYSTIAHADVDPNPIVITNVTMPPATYDRTVRVSTAGGLDLTVKWLRGLRCIPGTVLTVHYKFTYNPQVLGTCTGEETQIFKTPPVVPQVAGQPIIVDITPHPIYTPTLAEDIRTDPLEIQEIMKYVRNGQRSGTLTVQRRREISYSAFYMIRDTGYIVLSPRYDWTYSPSVAITPKQSAISVDCVSGQLCTATITSSVSANLSSPTVFIEHTLTSADDGCSARIANESLGEFTETATYVFSATYTHDVEVAKERAGICAITNNITASLP